MFAERPENLIFPAAFLFAKRHDIADRLRRLDHIILIENTGWSSQSNIYSLHNFVREFSLRFVYCRASWYFYDLASIYRFRE